MIGLTDIMILKVQKQKLMKSDHHWILFWTNFLKFKVNEKGLKSTQTFVHICLKSSEEAWLMSSTRLKTNLWKSKTYLVNSRLISNDWWINLSIKLKDTALIESDCFSCTSVLSIQNGKKFYLMWKFFNKSFRLKTSILSKKFGKGKTLMLRLTTKKKIQD